MVGARRPETRWVTRLIPLFLAGCLGFSTYVFVKRICVDFYIENRGKSNVAAIFLTVSSVFLILMVLTYLRVLLVIQFDPGVVPLGPLAVEQKEKEKERQKKNGCCNRGGDDLEANRYEGYWPDPNVDSPGLERFYSKDIFICYTDGRPRWCSTCSNWKQDRVSHCSEIDRCVKKMDHYCPWVGGIVGETSFKFFVQFTFYAAIYCIVALVAAGMSMRESLQEGATADGFVIGLLVISGFFGIFTLAMTATSVRYVCVNLTNVDYLKAKTLVHQIAIRVPRGTPPGPDYGVITYPLPKPQPQPSPTTPQSSDQTSTREPVSPRDLLAQRTFAVVRTEKGENPFDIGVYRNWKSVMGTNIIDWLLPLNRSPCENFENNESFYQMGPLIQELRARFKLPDLPPGEKGGVELSELNGPGKREANGNIRQPEANGS